MKKHRLYDEDDWRNLPLGWQRHIDEHARSSINAYIDRAMNRTIEAYTGHRKNEDENNHNR